MRPIDDFDSGFAEIELSPNRDIGLRVCAAEAPNGKAGMQRCWYHPKAQETTKTIDSI
jgi:hypothetical protein